MRGIGNKILEKAGELMKQDRPYRSDLYLSDYCIIGKDSANLLIAYSDMGHPDISDVEQFILGEFRGKLVPVSKTATRYPAEGATSIIARFINPRRSLKDAEKMVRVAPSTYKEARVVQADVDVLWDVEEDAEGHKYLLRRSDQNLDELLEAKKAMQTKHSPSFQKKAAFKVAQPLINVGDVIKYYSQEMTQVGTVTAVGDNGTKLTVRPTQGAEVTVDIGAVFQVVSRSPAAQKSTQERLLDYYTEVFGPEYARELVSKHPSF